ncbi:MAG: hypothetical protein HF314_17770 [Ignavibacteria bacterium]|jgi:hypothetical protein|nr:hypothetical protein [Ignavibacteria bacterium]MCU7504936.1 hypothetical protein [Ignavibacteria bacterium]MCU7518405.1 hypothetical protein [Ignavibacteria bacterium]
MNRILKFILAAVPVAVFFSCSTEPDKQDTYYLIKVDSLTHPASVSLNDTIKFRFYGVVGTDGCHSFSHFEALDKSSGLDLWLWGKVPSYADACPAVMVYLNGKEYKHKAKERGIFRLSINQPDGSVLKDSVAVQ